MGWYRDWKPYISVAQRRAQAAREVARRTKTGEKVTPVVIEGRTIAATFWGKAWCTNLESYSDFANRLPRGRSYVRNGSVVHLQLEKGRIRALVSGSELYEIAIEIAALSPKVWSAVKEQCAGKIGTLVELLQGKLSKGVMEVVTDRDEGLFPKPREIKMSCSCPDYAGMCKHIAAVMYGVGNRLDTSPELLFALRGLDHMELIEQAVPTAPRQGKGNAATIDVDDLGAIFDIEIGESSATPPAATARKKAPAKARTAKATKVTVKATTPKASKKEAKSTTKPLKAKSVTTVNTARAKKATTTTKRKQTPASKKG